MNRLAIVLCFVLFQSCTTSKVVHFSNEELDYSQFETYQLINYKVKDQSNANEGQLLYQSIEEGIHRELEQRQYSDSFPADLLIRYEVVSSLAVDKNRPLYDTNSTNNINGYNQNLPITPSFSIPEGILLIEIKTKKTNKLVWQASLDMKYQKNKETKNILDHAIKEIFATYLHQANSNDRIGNED